MAERSDLVLVARGPCDICHGSGEVASDEWEALRDAERRRSRSIDPEQFFLDEQDFDAVPPMNRECGNCDGTGTVETTIAVEALIVEVLARVPTTVLSREELRGVIEDLKATITGAALRSRGLADADDAQDNLRTVVEAAEALRAVSDLLGDDR